MIVQVASLSCTGMLTVVTSPSSAYYQVEAKCMLRTSKRTRRIGLTVRFHCVSKWRRIYGSMWEYAEIA